MAFNLNLNVKTNLKKQIEKEASGGRDGRFLNYFDLKKGEKMKVLFLPDANGEFWQKFSKHGPNLKLPGLEPVACPYKAARQECAACQKGFDLLNQAKELGEKTPEGKELKDEAKRWFAKDYTLVQVLVLDTPVEIAEADDGNQVKLMYLPFAIEKIIKNAVVEGIVEEDEISSVPFYIKKTENQGGQAAYTDSYFSPRETVGDDDLAFFEGLKVEQYDYSKLDVVPEDASSEEVVAWMEKAEAANEKKSKPNDNSNGGRSKQQDTRSKVSDRLGRGSDSVTQEDDRGDDMDKQQEESTRDADADADTDTGPDEKPTGSTRGSALRERLARTRR